MNFALWLPVLSSLGLGALTLFALILGALDSHAPRLLQRLTARAHSRRASSSRTLAQGLKH